MLESIKKIIRKFGIDGAIGYSLFSRMLQAITGVFTLLFVVNFLTTEEQGYFYTFGSILAVQVFFELGLSGIIVQYVAHEASEFTWNSKYVFEGDLASTSRLSSLLRFSIKWFSIVSIVLFFILIIVGVFFFSTYGEKNNSVEWKTPWLLLALTTSLLLILSPILAFLEGMGKVKEVARIRLIQQVSQILLTYSFFFIGLKLYAVPLASLITFILVLIVIYVDGLKNILVLAWEKLGCYKIDYKKEIFPYQWKIALSWVSGFFIFQLFNPVLFATEGAVSAGQMGMTLAVLNAIFSLTFSWISTKVPLFSSMIARQEYNDLDLVFNRALRQSALLNLICLIVFFSVVQILDYLEIIVAGKEFFNRFLSVLPLVFMIVPIFLNHIIGAWATYLRCHKKEPMLVQSIVMGVLCSTSTIVLGNLYGVMGITMGYLLLTIGSFIWTYFTFSKLKNVWHV